MTPRPFSGHDAKWPSALRTPPRTHWSRFGLFVYVATIPIVLGAALPALPALPLPSCPALALALEPDLRSCYPIVFSVAAACQASRTCPTLPLQTVLNGSDLTSSNQEPPSLPPLLVTLHTNTRKPQQQGVESARFELLACLARLAHLAAIPLQTNTHDNPHVVCPILKCTGSMVGHTQALPLHQPQPSGH
ncbi:hypothetical protein PMIN05_001312 [Paraphaeosphaeria minitans]